MLNKKMIEFYSLNVFATIMSKILILTDTSKISHHSCVYEDICLAKNLLKTPSANQNIQN